MTTSRWLAVALAAAVCAAVVHLDGAAQDKGKAVFAAPKRIQAGDAFLGEGRLYPSPVLHDVDGDKLADIIVGDLPGRVTVARRVAGAKGVRFAAEKPLKARNGKPLRFHNW